MIANKVQDAYQATKDWMSEKAQGAREAFQRQTTAAKARYHAGKTLANATVGQNPGFGMNRIMSVIFGVILVVAAAIPVTQQVINDQNLSGTPATIVGLIPLFLALAALAVVMGMFKNAR